jgi:hypothetical protein
MVTVTLQNGTANLILNARLRKAGAKGSTNDFKRLTLGTPVQFSDLTHDLDYRIDILGFLGGGNESFTLNLQNALFVFGTSGIQGHLFSGLVTGPVYKNFLKVRVAPPSPLVTPS